MTGILGGSIVSRYVFNISLREKPVPAIRMDLDRAQLWWLPLGYLVWKELKKPRGAQVILNIMWHVLLWPCIDHSFR